ncbi:MAG TPA: valine--tRNA ligase [Candidatus Eremiobacteraceae bacterium]|nr:valine--tRNA ligase [Candidatus Eremiobacteraceae bacterium]
MAHVEAPELEPMLDKYDPAAIEQRWYEIWESEGAFHAEPDPDRKPFVIAMPPPNITGRAHMGHGSTYTPQDILVRWNRMRGRNAVWLPGQDHAAIATQNVVEKELAKEGKTRFDLGRDAFIARVWEWRREYGDVLYKQFRALGFGPDWERDRFTMDDGMSRAVIKVFVDLYNEGLIYRGTRLINWCPRCASTLSDSEVEREEREGTLYYVRYAGADGAPDAVVATTRPETIFADVAVAVHPEDDRYKAFIGKHVMRPLSPAPIPVIADNSVEREFGTGALKITPAHDFTDNEIGERHGLPQPSVIGFDAKLTGDVEPEFKGLDRLEARELAVRRLRERGLLVKEEPHATSIGICYRCETPIEPLLSLQWFVKMKPLAEPALGASRDGRVRFVPERYQKTYEDWLERIRDWNISRQIWWGHRLPVWYCSDDHATVAQTEPEKCATCGRMDLRRDEDTLDTWFSSGLWPFSILGWPDKTKELDAWYPTQVLVTAREIIFLWVARMVMLGIHFMKRDPFSTVFITPVILDAAGEKMSKSKGNSLDPLELVRDFGADATRFGIVNQMHAGQDVRFAVGRCDDARKFCNKLWQAVRFALTTFPELGEAREPLTCPDVQLTLADRYILDALAQTVQRVDAAYREFDFSEASDAIRTFVWNEVCDVYIEIAKDRAPTRACILGRVLTVALQLLHPIMPFITEELWQRLPHEEPRIGKSAWPDGAAAWIDKGSRAEMAQVLGFVDTVLALRGVPKLPYRELREVFIDGASPDYVALLKRESEIVERLGRASAVRAIGDGEFPKPESALSRRIGSAQVFLPVDAAVVERERASLDKEIEKSEREIDVIERKLASEGFVRKAPADVVEGERQRLQELKRSLELARDRRATL